MAQPLDADERWIHPLLRAQTEGAAEGDAAPGDGAAAESATPEGEAPQASDGNQPGAETQPAPAPEADYRFSRSSLYKELRSIMDSDPSFRNAVKSLVGREETAEARRQRSVLEAELNNTRLELARIQLSSMSEEDVQARYVSDPEFAKVVDMVGNNQVISLDAVEQRSSLESAIEDTLDRARSHGLPDEAIQWYQARLAPGGCSCALLPGPHGLFDHDENGRPLSDVEGVLRLRNMVDSDADIMRAQASAGNTPPPPAAAPVASQAPQSPPPSRQDTAAEVAEIIRTRANPALGDATPDMSGSAASPLGRVFTAEDIRRMTPPQLAELFPNQGDYERAVEAGRVTLSTS